MIVFIVLHDFHEIVTSSTSYLLFDLCHVKALALAPLNIKPKETVYAHHVSLNETHHVLEGTRYLFPVCSSLTKIRSFPQFCNTY